MFWDGERWTEGDPTEPLASVAGLAVRVGGSLVAVIGLLGVGAGVVMTGQALATTGTWPEWSWSVFWLALLFVAVSLIPCFAGVAVIARPTRSRCLIGAIVGGICAAFLLVVAMAMTPGEETRWRLLFGIAAATCVLAMLLLGATARRTLDVSRR